MTVLVESRCRLLSWTRRAMRPACPSAPPAGSLLLTVRPQTLSSPPVQEPTPYLDWTSSVPWDDPQTSEGPTLFITWKVPQIIG